MSDVIYKRSFYDKICRGIVGVGLLYAYTKGVVAIDDFKDNRKSDYSIIELAGNDMLMYKANNEMIKIDNNWFIPDNENTNKTFSIETLDSVVNNVASRMNLK